MKIIPDWLKEIFGGSAINNHQDPMTDEVMSACLTDPKKYLSKSLLKALSRGDTAFSPYRHHAGKVSVLDGSLILASFSSENSGVNIFFKGSEQKGRASWISLKGASGRVEGDGLNQTVKNTVLYHSIIECLDELIARQPLALFAKSRLEVERQKFLQKGRDDTPIDNNTYNTSILPSILTSLPGISLPSIDFDD